MFRESKPGHRKESDDWLWQGLATGLTTNGHKPTLRVMECSRTALWWQFTTLQFTKVYLALGLKWVDFMLCSPVFGWLTSTLQMLACQWRRLTRVTQGGVCPSEPSAWLPCSQLPSCGSFQWFVYFVRLIVWNYSNTNVQIYISYQHIFCSLLVSHVFFFVNRLYFSEQF